MNYKKQTHILFSFYHSLALHTVEIYCISIYPFQPHELLAAEPGVVGGGGAELPTVA